MKFAAGFLTAMLVMQPRAETVEMTQLVVRQVAAEQRAHEPTPIIDSMVDWDEVDRQNECLWVYLQELGVELTLESVWAAGELTDALGGACAVIGED